MKSHSFSEAATLMGRTGTSYPSGCGRTVQLSKRRIGIEASSGDYLCPISSHGGPSAPSPMPSRPTGAAALR